MNVEGRVILGVVSDIEVQCHILRIRRHVDQRAEETLNACGIASSADPVIGVLVEGGNRGCAKKRIVSHPGYSIGTSPMLIAPAGWQGTDRSRIEVLCEDDRSTGRPRGLSVQQGGG